MAFLSYLPAKNGQVELHASSDGQPYLVLTSVLGTVNMDCQVDNPYKNTWVGVLRSKRWDSIKLKAFEKQALETALEIWDPKGVYVNAGKK